MAIRIEAALTCDMCGRAECVELDDHWNRWRKHLDAADVVKSAGDGWAFLDDGAQPVTDEKSRGHVLCAGCAGRLRETVSASRAALDALFGR